MRSNPARVIRATAFVLGLAGLIVATAWAHHYQLESVSKPAPLLRNGRPDAAIEPAAAAPIGDGRRVLVADDRVGRLHVVAAATGMIVGELLALPRFGRSSGHGPEWTGMTRDSEGNYYLAGSHAGRTDEERATNSVIVRFRLKDGETPAIDDATVVRWSIAGALEAALRSHGLDPARVAERRVEALAIREGGGRRELVFGLSAPADKVRAYAADITAAPGPGATLEPRPLFWFDAGAREGLTARLTSMEYVELMGGFLLLTASVDSGGAFHQNTLWLVSNGERRRAKSYATLEPGMKAAGLAVLGARQFGGHQEIRLLITYDNDPHATKKSSRFQTALVTHDRN